MLVQSKYINIFFWLFVITSLIIQSRFFIFSLPDTVIIFFEILLLLFLLYSMWKYKKQKHWILLDIYLIWIVICSIRGYFIFENYWEAKNLVENILSLSVPLVYFIFANNPTQFNCFLIRLKKFFIPISILIIIISAYSTIWGRVFAPIVFFLFLSIYFPKKVRLLFVCISILIIVSDIAARSLFIKYGVPIFIVLFLVHRVKINLLIIKLFHAVSFIIPIVLLSLGLSGQFNIFKIQEYIDSEITYSSSYGTNESVLDDTRTLIYEEQILSALNNGYLIAGRTPARGYDSKWGEIFIEKLYDTQNTAGDKGKKLKAERYKCEVGILNIFNWLGIFGVIIYSLLFFQASWLAIYKSNNTFIKILGLYVACRWAFSWIEDNISMDSNQFILWICIVLCYSYTYRKMTDYQIYHLAYSILKNNGKKYRKIQTA